MITYKEYNVKFPVYALSYVINGDSSGLESHEVEIIDRYMREFERETESVNGSMIVALDDNESEAYFTRSPAFGVACDVMDVTIAILI